MSELCSGCGEVGCGSECVYGNDYYDDPNRPCEFCGDMNCDGTGYNCPDEHYQTYNVQGPGISGTRR